MNEEKGPSPSSRQPGAREPSGGRASVCSPSSSEVGESVAQRFEAQVEMHASRPAIQCQDALVNYGDLNETANRIGRVVSGESSDRVALLFDQSIGAIASMLGVLKAGRAYVPLDPGYPRVRTTFMVADSMAELILTDSKHYALAQGLASQGCRVINIEEIPSTISRENLNVPAPVDVMAYILYTSGSTGKPKGVIQTQRNLLHFVGSYTSGLQINCEDRLTLLYSLSFSASLMDIYGSLLNGATLLLFDVKQEGTVRLSEWLSREKITVYHSVPTVFRHFLDGLDSHQKFSSIRAIDLGGEIVTKADVERFRRHFVPPCILVNHLAFTEASVAARYFIGHATDIEGDRVPAGYPAEGVEIRVTDSDGNEVHPGDIGQVEIRSKYVSPGYWRNPDLTREAFLPDPEDGDKRIYRTGDFGRMRPEGLLEFVGRADTFVKIRGHSIDVAEVETALKGLNPIEQAIVTARPDGDYGGNERLVAYLTLKGQHQPSVESIRRQLSSLLPEYMVPAAFMFLDQMPLTPTGKVNRRALPEVSRDRPHLRKSYAPPHTKLEENLAAIWKTILNLDDVGAADNFFDLGGNSLLAVRLVVEVEKQLGRALPLASVITAPTIRGLAAELSDGSKSPTSNGLVPLQTGGNGPPLFCIAGAGGTVFCFRELARKLGPAQTVYGLQWPGLEQHEKSFGQMEKLAAKFNRRMREVQARGPYYLCGYSVGGVAAYEMARQLTQQGEDVAFLGLLDARAPGSIRPRPFWQRLKMHGQNLNDLRGSKKIGYLFVRIANVLRRTDWRQDGIGLDRCDRDSSVAARIAQVEVISQKAFRQFRPKSYSGHAVLFKSALEPAWWAFSEVDPLYGWDRLVQGRVEVCVVPGGHLELFNREPVEVLAEKMRQYLDETRSRQ
jgi:amino acid adenylation domain-containing protein